MDRGRSCGAHKGEAGVATTSVEDQRAAVLGAGRFVPIPIGRDMSQMALEQEVSGILHELARAWRQGQDKHESTDLGAPSVHRL